MGSSSILEAVPIVPRLIEAVALKRAPCLASTGSLIMKHDPWEEGFQLAEVNVVFIAARRSGSIVSETRAT